MKTKHLGIFLAIVVGIALPTGGAEPDQSSTPAPGKSAGAEPKTAPTQHELEQKFALELSGATLAGHYTVDGRSGAPSEDRYAIAKVTKLEGEVWKFDVRIVYGKHDVTVPLPLTVKWAGDTPVITLTDLAIPTLGTYTAHVLIYRGQYAGTWSTGDHGGELWGQIEKPDGSEPDKKKSEQKTEAASKNADKSGD